MLFSQWDMLYTEGRSAITIADPRTLIRPPDTLHILHTNRTDQYFSHPPVNYFDPDMFHIRSTSHKHFTYLSMCSYPESHDFNKNFVCFTWYPYQQTITILLIYDLSVINNSIIPTRPTYAYLNICTIRLYAQTLHLSPYT